jgi:hypothetical protein
MRLPIVEGSSNDAPRDSVSPGRFRFWGLLDRVGIRREPLFGHGLKD